MDSVRARAIDASSLCLVVQVPASTSPRLQPRVRCSPEAAGFASSQASGSSQSARRALHIAPLRRRLRRRLGGGRTVVSDDEDVSFEEDIVEEDQQSEEDEVGEDDDEMADFIVDEEEIDANGQIIRQQVKRKPIRQAAGVSSSALQESHDIFGDVDELLALRKQELERDAANSGELRGKRLEDKFESFILA